MAFIKVRLISIMVKRDFLCKLSDESKKETIKKIMMPANDAAIKYAAIEKYVDKSAGETLALFNNHFRSGYNANIIARYDKDKNCVCADIVINYITYNIGNNFEKFIIGFEDENSTVGKFAIIMPNKQRRVIQPVLLNAATLKEYTAENSFMDDPSLKKGYNFPLPPELENYEQLEVDAEITEYGSDHWHLLSVRITKPCNDFSLNLSCEEELIIRKYILFGEDNLFEVRFVEKTRKTITIKSHEWVKPGMGCVILIAKEEKPASQKPVIP
jgi:hypothetical protein